MFPWDGFIYIVACMMITGEGSIKPGKGEDKRERQKEKKKKKGQEGNDK
jgi:hypothetical protein